MTRVRALNLAAVSLEQCNLPLLVLDFLRLRAKALAHGSFILRSLFLQSSFNLCLVRASVGQLETMQPREPLDVFAFAGNQDLQHQCRAIGWLV